MTNTLVSRTPRVRLIVGAVAAIAVAAAGAAVVVAPWPGLLRSPAAIIAEPPASASVAVCDGPILAAGRDAAAAGLVTDAAEAQIVSGASDGSEPLVTELAAASVDGGAGPVAVTAEPVGGIRTDIAGAGSAQIDESDLRGYAASACTRATMQSWLVGGSGSTGAADLVVLANPGEVAARVTLTVYGAEGPTIPTAGEDLRVAAGTQIVIPLAGLALGEESPVIQVTAAEAPVRASLQTAITRGLLPGGVDQAGASASPDSDLVIPAFRIAMAPGADDASDVPAFLRLLSPTDVSTATVTISDDTGPVGDAYVLELAAGIPLELDLTGLPVGTYTAHVSATAPTTGAVWSTTGFGAGSDFAWFVAADDLTSPALVAVAAGPDPTLTLTSTAAGDERVELVADAGAGAAQEIAVPAGESIVVTVEGDTVYRIDPGEGSVRAAVAYAGSGQLAGYPVPASDVAAATIEVFPR